MGRGALFSALLHGVVILLCFTGVMNFFHRELEPPPVIPIEILNISDVSQAKALKVKPKDETPEQEVEEDKPVPPKPVHEPEPEPKPEPEVKPEPEPKAEKKEPEPEVKPEPDVTLDDLLAAIPEEKPKEKPKEKEKKKDKKKEKPKKKKKDFTSVLNNVDKLKSSSKGKTQLEQDPSATEDYAANRISDTLSVSEMDLIRRQFAACWNIPAGARDAQDLFVDVRVEMNSDATVRSAGVIRASRNDSYGQAAAAAALRAVNNPKCNPLRVPLDRYDQWKVIVIRFDPQHM